MKLLPLDFTHRNFLVNKCALKLDEEGNETLAGLSCLESEKYLKMFDDATKGILPDCTEDLNLFLLMHEKHTTELPYMNWLFNTVYVMNQPYIASPKDN